MGRIMAVWTKRWWFTGRWYWPRWVLVYYTLMFPIVRRVLRCLWREAVGDSTITVTGLQYCSALRYDAVLKAVWFYLAWPFISLCSTSVAASRVFVWCARPFACTCVCIWPRWDEHHLSWTLHSTLDLKPTLYSVIVVNSVKDFVSMYCMVVLGLEAIVQFVITKWSFPNFVNIGICYIYIFDIYNFDGLIELIKKVSLKYPLKLDWNWFKKKKPCQIIISPIVNLKKYIF